MLKMIRYKSIITLIGVIIIAIFSFFYCSSCKTTERTDYIFQQNHSGWMIVVFNEKNEKKCQIKNGRVQIEMPKNGVLFTSSKRPHGILDNNYFSKKGDGTYEKIYPSLNSMPHSDTTSFYVLVESYQSLRFYKPEKNSQREVKNSSKYINYDEVILFKIVTGFSDTTATKKDIDNYLNSIKEQLIAHSQNR